MLVLLFLFYFLLSLFCSFSAPVKINNNHNNKNFISTSESLLFGNKQSASTQYNKRINALNDENQN